MNETKKNENVAVQNKAQQVKSLDDLIEVLEQDDLRHVTGGAERPKGMVAEH